MIKTVKVYISLNLIFYKPLGSDRISDLVLKTDPIQSKFNNII